MNAFDKFVDLSFLFEKKTGIWVMRGPLFRFLHLHTDFDEGLLSQFWGFDFKNQRLDEVFASGL